MSKKSNRAEVRDYLNDILEMISASKDFTKNLTYAEFKRDKKTLFAVIRCLEVIGEASKQIPPSSKKVLQSDSLGGYWCDEKQAHPRIFWS
jgi:uncharacterized protein with HEPN domain